MSKYLRMQATAARLIKENGAPFQFRRPITVKDTVAGTVTNTYETQMVDTVVLIPGGSLKLNSVEQITGENLSKLSKMNNLLLSPKTPVFPLSAPVEIFYENSWWLVELVSPLKPDGKTLILYKAFMRRP